MKLKQYLTLLLLLLGTAAWGQALTSTLTFNAACGGSGTADDGVVWTVSSDAAESAYESDRGIHYGTGSVAVSYLRLTTSGIPGTITKIVVNASGASKTTAKLNVTVGGNAFGSEKSLTSSATEYTFEGSASGEITVSLTQGTAKRALYVKSVAVTYSDKDITLQSNNDDWGTVSISGTTITAIPKVGYQVSTSNPCSVSPDDAADISYNGDNTFSVSNITANCTITINFETKPTNLYIKTGANDWNPYVWAWTNEGDIYDSWWSKPQATELVTINGIKWHKITVPSNEFSFNLSDGQGDSGSKTDNIGPINSDTYIVYNSEQEDGISNKDYLIVDFADVTATNVNVSVGATGKSTITNNTGIDFNYSYQSNDTNVAIVDSSTGIVTGVSNGSTTITVNWPTTRIGNSHSGWMSGNTTFQAVVGPASGSATFIFETEEGLAALGITKPNSGNGTNISGGTYTSGVVSMTTTDGSTETRVWNSGGETDLRVYSGGSLTFNVREGCLITSITFTTGDNFSFYNVSNKKWNGTPASSVTLTAKEKSFIKTITVSYSVYSTVPAPTFSPTDGTTFLNNLSVALSAEGNEDIIYYTTDGTTPTTASTQYSEPFTITETTTVKAIAVRNGESSIVASATYTKMTGPEAPIFNPASGAVVKVGSRIKIVPAPNSTVSHLHFRINEGDVVTRETNNDNYINVTEDMVGTLTVEAWHTYDYEGETLVGTHSTATYTVVNPQVSFDQPETVFATTFEVTLTKSPEDATVYYTTDESTPTTESTPYTGAITLSATTTIKAIAVVNGVASDVVTATYEKNEPAVSSESDVFVLVTDDSTLADGDQILVVNGSEKKIMDKRNWSTSGENRAADSFTFNSDESITQNDPDKIFTLKEVEETGRWMLYWNVENGQYLYSGTGGNYLKLSSNEGEGTDKTATISIDESYNAKIAYDETRWIMLNNNGSLFSCYKGTQKPVQIYRNQAVNAITLKESWDDNTTNASIISGALNEKRSVNLYRQLTADMWNAICLPFDVNEANMKKLFGEGYLLRTFSGVQKNGNSVTLMFSEATTIVAGVPYIVLPQKSVERNAVVVLGNVTMTNAKPTVVTQTDTDGNKYTFQGIYEPTSFEAGNTSIRFLGSGNKFYYPSNSNPMRAFRCYFQLPTDVAAKLSNLDMAFDGGIDVATGIIAIGTDVSPLEQATGHIYSVSGQHVGTKAEGLPKGLYIRDGKKFVVK